LPVRRVRWVLNTTVDGETAQKGRCEGGTIPAQTGRQPFQHAKPAGAVLAFKPTRSKLADAPAKPVRLYQQFNAVAKPLI
jgi:hypothetical protein